ncbi:MAG TPA: molybdenum cofactor biosynthesis protein MoaE [Cyclobacteriaceae bacterium]|nr:molybdenum cofactor biosynthesis protein MoaE [Cyclobacteriaceae bacterium]
MIEVLIRDKPLDIKSCYQQVKDAAAGGIDVFVGTVRNQTKEKKVLRLEYEAYAPMAEKEIRRIIEKAAANWKIIHAVVHHRIGTLMPEEEAVIIALSTAHRQAAFEACKYIIDEMKQTVPIWKKEVFENGEEWVSAHP